MVLLSFLVAHLAITIFVTVPGYLNIDEAVYHLMSRSFALTHDFEIVNGYHEYPSLEFGLRFFFPVNGRLVSQYPNLFPVLAHPFYLLWGLKGLFVLNSLSFFGVVAVSYLLVYKLFKDQNMSATACLVLCCATFCWEYSQAGWPHMIALFSIIGGFYLALSSRMEQNTKKACLYAFLAGLVISISAGIRVDVFLVAPCACALMILGARQPVYLVAAVVTGTLPGILLLAAVNLDKFGVFSPFYYGTGKKFPVSALIIAFLLLGLLWMGRIWFPRISVATRKYLLVAAVFMLAISGICAVSTERGTQIVRDAYSSVIDIRAVPMEFDGPALVRTRTGGMVYIGAQKKALLQSLPYLAVLVLPLLLIVKGGSDRRKLLILLPVPLVYIGYYAYINHEYGGLCLNYRYHLPVLPFTSILVAYAVKQIQRDLARSYGAVSICIATVVTIIVTVVCYSYLTALESRTVSDLEFPLLTVPLLLSVVLLFLITFGYVYPALKNAFIVKTIWIVMISALCWSALTAFSYDYRIHHLQRVAHYEKGGRLLKIVPSDSIFFTALHLDPFLRVIEDESIRICFPYRDNFKDFSPILDFHLNAGRRVFALFSNVQWRDLQAGVLMNFHIDPVWVFHDGYIAEISRE